MNDNALKTLSIPQGFKEYKTFDGKFSDIIGPYFVKGKYPNTVFITKISEKQTNLNSVAHGGFLMAFADTIGGNVAFNSVKKRSVTASFNASFIRPAPIENWLEGKGYVIKHGKRAIFIEVVLTLNKKIVFKANGIWQIINIDNR